MLAKKKETSLSETQENQRKNVRCSKEISDARRPWIRKKVNGKIGVRRGPGLSE